LILEFVEISCRS